jgi:hypothetical protein
VQLNKLISVKTTLTKSINLDRDRSTKELLESYVLTSTAMQSIQNVINTQKNININKLNPTKIKEIPAYLLFEFLLIYVVHTFLKLPEYPLMYLPRTMQRLI